MLRGETDQRGERWHEGTRETPEVRLDEVEDSETKVMDKTRRAL